jgi:nucleoside 2-deoxyribosyltransferase
MKKTRIYLSGPISNNPTWREDFAKAKKRISKCGFKDCVVVSPADIDMGDDEYDWSACMRKCIAVMAGCDKVVVLQDGDASIGRSVEITIAQLLDIHVISLDRQCCTEEPF